MKKIAISPQNQGFTFLELLVALALFSSGLLGILQLQFMTHRHLQEAVYTTRAVQQAYNLSAQLTVFNATSGSALAWQLQHAWNSDNKKLLPQGQGAMTANSITVFWEQERQISVQLQRGRSS